MGFKLKSSGLSFKELGSSPAKMHEPGHKEKGRYGKAERKELKKVKTKGMSASDFDETTVKTEKQAFKEMSNTEKLKYYKSTKKPNRQPGGRKSIKSSDLTDQQLKNIR